MSYLPSADGLVFGHTKCRDVKSDIKNTIDYNINNTKDSPSFLCVKKNGSQLGAVLTSKSE